jgi:hypothetical protein
MLSGLLVLLALHGSESWTPQSAVSFRRTTTMTPPIRNAPLCFHHQSTTIGCHPTHFKSHTSSTTLYMYSLPPSGGGGNKNELVSVLQSVAGLVLFVGFFLSPLGGFVLSIFNSFLLLALLIPVAGVVGFQVWQYLNTMKGPCPNCGAEVQVLKSQPNVPDAPTICFSCGAIVQANYDNTGIDNVTGRKSVSDGDNDSPFNSLFDLFGGAPTSLDGLSQRTTSSSSTTTIVDNVIVEERTGKRKEPPKNPRRDRGVIDVDVVEDDKPFQ